MTGFAKSSLLHSPFVGLLLRLYTRISGAIIMYSSFVLRARDQLCVGFARDAESNICKNSDDALSCLCYKVDVMETVATRSVEP